MTGRIILKSKLVQDYYSSRYIASTMTTLVLLTLAATTGLGYCLNKVMLVKDRGLYLKESFIRAVHGNTEFECGVHCSKEPLCVSVNFKTSGKDQGRCELNNATLGASKRNNCLRHPEYSYLEILNRVRKVLFSSLRHGNYQCLAVRAHFFLYYSLRC